MMREWKKKKWKRETDERRNGVIYKHRWQWHAQTYSDMLAL